MKVYLILAILCSTLMVILSCSAKKNCGNRISSEINNANKRIKIVVFERDCGATTGTSVHVSILKASEELKNEDGNIFISDFMKPDLSWQNDSTIVIRRPQTKAKIYKKESNVRGIQVLYEVY